jgi:hypothetical protein
MNNKEQNVDGKKKNIKAKLENTHKQRCLM